MVKKTKEVYVCELCKYEYNTQEEAEACEKSHLDMKGIKEARYTRRHCYPETISIEMADSHKVVYKFFKDLEEKENKEKKNKEEKEEESR